MEFPPRHVLARAMRSTRAAAILVLSCLPGAWGASVVPPVHRKATLYPVVVRGRWGFINRKGRVVVAPRFDEVRPCVEGVAAYREGAKWGLVLEDGRTILGPYFDGAGAMSEGMMAVRKDTGGSPSPRAGWDFLSKAVVRAIAEKSLDSLPLRYQFSICEEQEEAVFSEGLACVMFRNYPLRGPGIPDSGAGYVDSRLSVVLLPADHDPRGQFSEGLAVVFRMAPAGGAWDGRYGFMDRSGAAVIVPAFNRARQFRDGLAPVKFAENRWGFITSRGASVTAPRFEDAFPFSEGLARVRARGRFGFVSKSGNLAVPARFPDAGDFWEGLAPASDEAGRWGYIDRHGRFAIRPGFDAAWGFVRGAAPVIVEGKLGYITVGGGFLWEPRN